jgi:hypothetical protein
MQFLEDAKNFIADNIRVVQQTRNWMNYISKLIFCKIS